MASGETGETASETRREMTVVVEEIVWICVRVNVRANDNRD